MRLSLYKSVPKFVTGCALILTAFVACDPSKDVPTTKSNKALGINTKAGLALSQSELCGIPTTDTAGKTSMTTLRFQQNAIFIRRTREMTTTSQFPIVGEARGTWGLVGDILFITENKVTAKHSFENVERESDKAQCVRFTTMENSPEFCPCEI